MKRRTFFKIGGGLVALGSLAYWQRNPLLRFALTSRTNSATPALAAEAGEDVCVLIPEQTSGPYYINSEIRSNITEGRPGLPLALEIEMVKLPDCTPLEGATVEIWHCDARGFYSGYGKASVRAPFDTVATLLTSGDHIEPDEASTFMRGGQVSDTSGRVQFETIFPGWYEPRITHIHVKVSHNDQSFLTTQLYFPDELAHDIHKNHPDYADYGTCPYNLTNDAVLGGLEDGAGVVLKTTRTKEKITASVRLGAA